MSANPKREGQVARATLVVTPRERYGPAAEALDSLLGTTEAPFDLVYVSGPLPHDLDARVRAVCRQNGFRHIAADRHLCPNEARNLGVRATRTDYVVFLDNDVFCQPGWLSRLVDAADETGADVVAPLTCQGWPLHAEVHQAGGEFAPDPAAFFAARPGRRAIHEKMHRQGERVADVSGELTRADTQLCEFHCALVRRAVFERIGPLDEDMLATKEHLDFCMSVLQAGGRVIFEPSAVVTYLIPNRHNPVTPRDWPYFLVRWSPTWQRRSLERFSSKWGLAKEGYLERRARMLSWRHDEGVAKAIARRLPIVGRHRYGVFVGKNLLRPAVRLASRALVAHDDAKRRRAAGPS